MALQLQTFPMPAISLAEITAPPAMISTRWIVGTGSVLERQLVLHSLVLQLAGRSAFALKESDFTPWNLYRGYFR